MPNAKNQSMLSAIKEDLEGAGAVWVVDACGLTVKEVEALRNAVRESGACMKVYKNTVMRIALSEADLPTLDDMLHGPSAFVFAGSDVAAAAKAVKEFAKSNENLQIKGGLMEGAAVSAAEVEAIASLPSRGAVRSHRRCHQRCGSGSGNRYQRCAAWPGSGRKGCCRSEGCVSKLLAA